ncbi:kinetochore Sim4 complex subunit FTA2-domain-containing protein [Apiospora arundinis]|uniref:Kinetochore Sim4 complex subunit FTA2-domain-containing protein n=1 Tax=Apiospora arundinis TaxID=335852 RepID=A0ABR2I944_9PEZI
MAKHFRDMWKLNDSQIYNRDIRTEKFVDGRLVDFVASWTQSHILLDLLHEDDKRDSRLEDLAMFDDMITEDDVKTSLEALPNIQYREKLRSGRGLV